LYLLFFHDLYIQYSESTLAKHHYKRTFSARLKLIKENISKSETALCTKKRPRTLSAVFGIVAFSSLRNQRLRVAVWYRIITNVNTRRRNFRVSIFRTVPMCDNAMTRQLLREISSSMPMHLIALWWENFQIP